ncbi:MAG: uracil-DNA glycosylase [Chloroflexota bacterium]
MDKIDSFIEGLAASKVALDAYNQYAPGDKNNDLRRHNLRLYFQHILERKPLMLFVAEAPGYRGCRLTGIPLVSRKILLEGIPELNLFGVGNGYLETHDSGFESINGEQSATIVWNVLREHKVVPLIWSTFPFHPHQPDKALTNRAPRRDEITAGKVFLEQVLKLADFKQVVAVGNVAEGALQSLGIACVKVRHPAQGGKNDFVRGIQAIMHNG